MKEGDATRDVSPGSGNWLGKNRYMAWALVVILLLAFWSMLSGSAGISRKWSAATSPYRSSRLWENPSAYVDALEMEVREKIVRHTWDKYRYNPPMRTSNFWHDSFEAAFEDLESDDAAVKDAAIQEIAKLSIHTFEVDLDTQKPKYELVKLQPYQSTSSRKSLRKGEIHGLN